MFEMKEDDILNYTVDQLQRPDLHMGMKQCMW